MSPAQIRDISAAASRLGGETGMADENNGVTSKNSTQNENASSDSGGFLLS